MYKTGPKIMLYINIGGVLKYDRSVNSQFHHAEYQDNQVCLRFLDIEDIKDTKCVMFRESYEMV